MVNSGESRRAPQRAPLVREARQEAPEATEPTEQAAGHIDEPPLVFHPELLREGAAEAGRRPNAELARPARTHAGLD